MACPWTGGRLPAGVAKNAWPELVGLKSAEAVDVLKASGIVKSVRVWAPTYETGKKAVPANRGTLDDVWVYTDQNDEVYEIPRRGVWHPNSEFLLQPSSRLQLRACTGLTFLTLCSLAACTGLSLS